MKKINAALLLVGLALAYYVGLIFLIGLFARLGPIPSTSPLLALFSQPLAVLLVALPVALLLVRCFATSALLLAVVVATPSVLDTLWLLRQAMPLDEGHFMRMIIDMTVVLLMPLVLSAVFLRLGLNSKVVAIR